MAHNHIADVSHLAPLINLDALALCDNQIQEIAPLAGLTRLTNLDLSRNQVQDISALAGLTNLHALYLNSNAISDIGALVSNDGLGEGDIVNLFANPLSEKALTEDIPALEARGVQVRYTPTVPPPPQDVVLRVDGCVENSGDGSAWDTAFKSIQEAVDAAAEQGGGEVWVAGGTYTGTTDIIVYLKKRVYLYGGFSGAETQRDERDWKANVTTIDGEHTRKCIAGENGILHGGLDGFVLASGKAVAGGGMSFRDAMLYVAHCVFRENEGQWGGAAYFEGISAPAFIECEFVNNKTLDNGDSGGGAMFNRDYASPQLIRCTLTGNWSVWGGVLFNRDYATPFLTNCVLVNNTVGDAGGALFNRDRSAPRIANCTFYGNSTKNVGGAFFNRDQSAPRIVNSILWQNTPNEVDSHEGTHPQIDFSLIRGGFAGEGNIAGDPMFVAPDTDDFRLQPGSPCIDAGAAENAPSTDILGTTRPQGAGVDIGAYEQVAP